jgi:hypothetical protein
VRRAAPHNIYGKVVNAPLYFEDDDPASLGFDKAPAILTNFEVTPLMHAGGLKVLTGEDLVAIFHRFGFSVVGGSKHVKLRRTTAAGDETLVIPYHDPIEGHVARDLSQASHYIIPRSDLRPHLYSD